jgi:hypothetical protein
MSRGKNEKKKNNFLGLNGTEPGEKWNTIFL